MSGARHRLWQLCQSQVSHLQRESNANLFQKQKKEKEKREKKPLKKIIMISNKKQNKTIKTF